MVEVGLTTVESASGARVSTARGSGWVDGPGPQLAAGQSCGLHFLQTFIFRSHRKESIWQCRFHIILRVDCLNGCPATYARASSRVPHSRPMGTTGTAPASPFAQ